MSDELRWSTGAVGPQHRAVMRGGKVMAVAEDTETAAHIVRVLNDAALPARNEQKVRVEKLRHDLQEIMSEIGQDTMLTPDVRIYYALKIQEALR